MKPWLKKQCFWLILISVLFLHYKTIRTDIKQLIADGQLRKSILNQIQTSYPVLPEKVVFYVESDKAYYGLPDEETILPFQSGFGQTLLVWYYHHGEKFPSCMFADGWLYPIEDQGYRYCQGRGFGYFRNVDDLDEAFQTNDLSPENLTAFEFHSEDESLNDITAFMRERLKEIL